MKPVTAIGLAMAFGLFGLTFRGARAKFWERMTLTGVVLGMMVTMPLYHYVVPLVKPDRR